MSEVSSFVLALAFAHSLTLSTSLSPEMADDQSTYKFNVVRCPSPLSLNATHSQADSSGYWEE